MKQTLLLILLTFTLKVSSQTTAIPDPNFEQVLVDRGWDTNGLNGNILNSDAAGWSYLDVASKNISNLQGIEAFVDLTGLQVADNNLIALDVSHNVHLTSLRFNQNNISTLNITGLTNLETLDGRQTPLTNLNLSGFPNLKQLYFENNNFTHFDIRNGANQNITNFWVIGSPDLTCIYVDDATASYLSSWNKDATTTFVYDEAGCASLGFDEYASSQINIFPNPVVDVVAIESPYTIKYVEVIDAIGRIVKVTNHDDINISTLQKGVYFLKVTTDNNLEFTKQIIKQ